LPSPLTIVHLGRVPYREAWDLQRKLQRELIEGHGKDTLILCEHEPVITLGRGAKPENVLGTPEDLAKRGIEVLAIERGGDVTYHGPGQLVGYPIIDLNRQRRDVGWYMRSIEEVILRSLSQWGIPATRIDGKTGVWIKSQQYNTAPNCVNSAPDRKIAALGVRISRWCTLHGFALNVLSCKEGFALINPCGFVDIEVTSIEEESTLRSTPCMTEVEDAVVRHFFEVFSFETGNDMMHSEATPLAKQE